MSTRTIASTLIAVCLSLDACASGGARVPDGIAHRGDRDGILARARILAGRGDHLYSSRYYEAALKRGAPEAEILPALVAQQVRGGRLLAALDSTARLSAIRGNPEEIVALHRLIEELTGHESELEVEVER